MEEVGAAVASTKCPVCGKAVAVGIVSGTFVQHEDKHGVRCDGSGTTPAPAAVRAPSTRSSSGSTRSSAAKPKDASPATKGGMRVSRVEVDPEELKARQERIAQAREERARAARERNATGLSYFDEPGAN
jgi:hypothetical protein